MKAEKKLCQGQVTIVARVREQGWVNSVEEARHGSSFFAEAAFGPCAQATKMGHSDGASKLKGHNCCSYWTARLPSSSKVRWQSPRASFVLAKGAQVNVVNKLMGQKRNNLGLCVLCDK